MSRDVTANSTDTSTEIRIVDSSGQPVTTVTASTPGLSLYYRRSDSAPVQFDASNLASASAPHQDGGLIHLFGGYYRVDVPDGAWVTGATSVLIGGVATDLVIIASEHAIVGSSSSGSSSGSSSSGSGDSDFSGLGNRIESVAAGPASVSGDGHSVTQQSINDLIAADKYLAGKTAATKKHAGLRITKLIQPGARGREPGC